MNPSAREGITLRATCLRWLICLALATMGGGTAVRSQAGELTVCHAGSLQSAFTAIEKEFTNQHANVKVNDVSGGSVALAGRMAAGTQPCDVFAAADYLAIDLLLKPIGVADYTIVFASGRMVLAYLATDPMTRGIAAAGDFRAPATIPQAAPDWYRVLLEPGVRVAGSHPFLDPAGYRSHMIFNLAQIFYNTPNLYQALLEHYTVLPAAVGVDAGSGRTLGRDFNFQFTYEHSAAAAAAANPAYRYLYLPAAIDLSTSSNNPDYAKATVIMPGIGSAQTSSPVALRATRVAWGLTIPKKSRNAANAVAFVNLVLGATGTAALTAHGPAPITPAIVSAADDARLPNILKSRVTSKDTP